MSNKNTIMMFVDDIIQYIDAKFSSDSRISATKKPTGNLAFSKTLIENQNKSFYVVQVLSNNVGDETFNNVVSLTVSLQIDVFALKGSFDKVQYLAEPMSIVLQDVISNYMSDLKFGNSNENILLMREITASPALPFEDGDRAYTSSLRYEFSITKDYNKVYQKQ